MLFAMAGSLFGRLSLEEEDSANSLEGLDIREGKNTGPPPASRRQDLCSLLVRPPG